MSAAESFIDEIETYLSQTGTSPTAFGKAVMGDPNFVGDLKQGRMPGLRVVDRVRDYIRLAAPTPHPAEVSP